jgi:myxalamid-type polyketide synthase MxaB
VKRTREEISAWLVARVAQMASMDASRIETGELLQTYGISSVRLIEMSGDLEDWLGATVDPMVFMEHPTIDGLSEHLASH